MLEIGSVVDNKYKILYEIDKGGTSHVYLALNEAANKEWAIKEVKKNVVIDGSEVRQRPMTETSIMKKLRHKHMPEIADILETEDTYLIVMDYIEGVTLKHVLKQEGAQKQEDVINWALQLCSVLKYLHGLTPPVIYRDMKPGNIMLKPDGNVMLIDFGAAREYKEGATDDTNCLGTKGYAAPEQYGGDGQTDARTDIYTLGATMYHLVTGKDPTRPPYEMRPIREWDKSLSTGLEEIIKKCTRNNPDDRYQSAEELMYALRHYREMEHEYREMKDRQWKKFLTACILAVMFFAGWAGTKVYAAKLQKGTYTELVRAGQTSPIKEDRVEAYIGAIKANPQESTAYMELLEDVFLEDGVFTQDEADTVTRIMGYKEKGNGKTIEETFSANRDGYTRFCYEMGIAFFYYYGENGNKPLSRPWFERVKDSTSLEESKRSRAERFYRIAEYYEKLGDKNKSGDSVISYADYWSDLLSLTRGDIIKEDNMRTALVMYRELTYQIGAHAVEFRAAGVSRDELASQLRRVQHIMDENADSISESDRKVADTVQENIKAAEKTLDTVFAE